MLSNGTTQSYYSVQTKLSCLGEMSKRNKYQHLFIYEVVHSALQGTWCWFIYKHQCFTPHTLTSLELKIVSIFLDMCNSSHAFANKTDKYILINRLDILWALVWWYKHRELY